MGSIRHLSSWLLASMLAPVMAVQPALAHNATVHQRMTDFAYHVLLVAEHYSKGGQMSEQLRLRLTALALNPAVPAFFADAANAVPKLQALKSGLPEDPTLCVAPTFGGGPPNWQLPPGVALADLPMAQVRLPVTVNYGHGAANCAIGFYYIPSGVLASVNPPPPPPGLTTRDHTGLTLGYWAAEPDQQTHPEQTDQQKQDWIFRSTTLEVIQNPAVVGGIGAGVTVAVNCACVLGCSFFPVLCALCPALAVGEAGDVIDKITSIDSNSIDHGMAPGDFVGLGHFIDMKPTPAGSTFFDSKPAKFMERAGPTGVPDATEMLVTAFFDLAGLHVNHDKSLAPKTYEILATDFHLNTMPRDKTKWEAPTGAHLQFTPLDNLAMFGYQQATALFVKGTSGEAFRLGWPLHALGDATVPMHVVGASGFGHRPYEDVVDMVYEQLLGPSDSTSVDTVIDVLRRALKWRKFIQDSRALRGTTNVPVRDLITALAATTLQKANAQPSVFQAAASLQYIVDPDAAKTTYDNPAMAAIQRDLLIEGIAAECAFLLSYTEVVP